MLRYHFGNAWKKYRTQFLWLAREKYSISTWSSWRGIPGCRLWYGRQLTPLPEFGPERSQRFWPLEIWRVVRSLLSVNGPLLPTRRPLTEISSPYFYGFCPFYDMFNAVFFNMCWKFCHPVIWFFASNIRMLRQKKFHYILNTGSILNDNEIKIFLRKK